MCVTKKNIYKTFNQYYTLYQYSLRTYLCSIQILPTNPFLDHF